MVSQIQKQNKTKKGGYEKMKILKRLISFLVITSMMLMSVSTVMAAELAAPASRTLTFDSFTEDTTFTENGGNTSVTFCNLAILIYFNEPKTIFVCAGRSRTIKKSVNC